MTWMILFSLLFFPFTMEKTEPEHEKSRSKMVETQIIARGISDHATIEAMRSVNRQSFVLKQYEKRAYDDGPLPIGYGQTISQPYIVAYMTEFLKLSREDKVLEIGSGSGYQAAVLGEICDSVFTVEIIEELGNKAQSVLASEGYDNVHVKIGDGFFGWKEHAPYDAIIVTAAAGNIPEPLLDQLAEGGRMIIPVGGQLEVQYLVAITKENGELKTRRLLPVRFVPFTRGHE